MFGWCCWSACETRTCWGSAPETASSSSLSSNELNCGQTTARYVGEPYIKYAHWRRLSTYLSKNNVGLRVPFNHTATTFRTFRSASYVLGVDNDLPMTNYYSCFVALLGILQQAFQRNSNFCSAYCTVSMVIQEGWLSPTERASVSAISLRHILASPGYANRNKCHMDEKRIQCLSNASQHVPIYFQPFPSNSTHKFKSSPF